MTIRLGVNVIGYASATIGLGVIAREVTRALLARGHIVDILDLDAGSGRSMQDMSLAGHFVSDASKLRHPINLWIIEAPLLVRCSLQIAADPTLQRKLNVAYAWWELPDLPNAWIRAAEVFDAVMGGSEYVCQNYANQITGVPTLLARTPLDMPARVKPDRSRFGFSAGEVVVYTGFEALSDPARKNPFAAIEAFQRAAAAGGPPSRLVVKVNHAKPDGRAYPLLECLYALVRDDSRMIVFTENLVYRDLMSLYASCDIFVSLHRAEGLGLMPLEAMRLGKPVLATGWSGNMTYMTHRNAALVNYRFTQPGDDAFVYSPARVGTASRWAEPDASHAAAWLQRLIADEPLRARIGANALEDSLAYDVRARRLEFMDELGMLAETRELNAVKDYAALAAAVRKAHEKHVHAQLPPVKRAVSLAVDRALTWYRRHVGWRFAGKEAR